LFTISTPGSKSSPEDSVELGVETTDAHLAEVPVRVDDGLPHNFALGLAAELDGGTFALLKDDGGVWDADANLVTMLFEKLICQ
jgi:hypothetical protein